MVGWRRRSTSPSTGTSRAVFDAEYDHNVVAVAAAGGVTAKGDLEGFEAIRYSGTDIGEAMDGAELVVLVGPAYGTERARRRRRAVPHGRHGGPGLSGVVCRGDRLQARSRARARGRARHRRRDQHAPVRGAGHGTAEVNVFLKLTTDVYLAALPRAGTDRLLDLVKDTWPAVERADSVFQTTLQNGNPVIHPAVTLLNAGLLERTHGGFLFYEEGVTESVGRLIEAVDLERLAIADALGVTGPLRARDRGPAGLHDRGELLHGLQPGAGLPRHQGAEPTRSPLPDRGRRLLAVLSRGPRRAPGAFRPR